ncbi:taurine catabolism dioxygenase [Paramyrothecium foliicola]|nr:taurine catabolism dioxygenase [Paramyrothecium foliicola]
MAPVKEPLILGGSLAKFRSFEVTPTIGTEFVNASLKDWLEGPNADELLRDLAITVSRRGVVFFRQQDGLTLEMQKSIVQKLGTLSGKPPTSTLHRHAVQVRSDSDPEILHINSEENKKILRGTAFDPAGPPRQSCRGLWHNDISYEPIPSDYALLRLTQVPESGGGMISRPVQIFLESLTATFGELRERDETDARFQIPRGSPLNVGTNLRPTHPVIRTNPVTGWKSVYALGLHVQGIVGLSADESMGLKDWLTRLVVENHDLQVRFRWNNVNDVAIWDNRCTYHSATYDHEGFGIREGYRVCGVGEKPYLDPDSADSTNPLADIPNLEPLPDDLDIFFLYQKVFSGESSDPSHINLWYSGIVTVDTSTHPPLLMLEAHNLVSHRVYCAGNDTIHVDWVQLVQFDSIMPSESGEKTVHNTLSGRTTRIPKPFFHPPGHSIVSRASRDRLKLVIDRPGIPPYEGQIIGGLIPGDSERVALIQVQPQWTDSKDGKRTYTQMTLMLVTTISAIRHDAAEFVEARGSFWGYQEGPLSNLFGFADDMHGRFQTLGQVVKGKPDEATVPGLWTSFLIVTTCINMFRTINIVRPAPGKEQRVREMLDHLVSEVQKHEPDALFFRAVWDEKASIFYVIEDFTNEAAMEFHRNQPYTAELRRVSRAEHNLAEKVEVRVVESFAEFKR